MKIKILAITLFVIGAFIACKKIEEKVETNNLIKTNSSTTDRMASTLEQNEQKRLNSVLNKYAKFTTKDKSWLFQHLKRIDNKFYGFDGPCLLILNKLTIKEQLQLFENVNPNTRITLFDKNEKFITITPSIPNDNRPKLVVFPDKYREAWPCDCRAQDYHQCYCWSEL